MGAWGTGILENDVALDASLSFDDVLQGGGTVGEAIAAAMKESEDLLDDEDDRSDLILALVWVASEHDAVPDWLAAEAHQVIRSGQAVSRWEESPNRAERQAVERLLLGILDGTEPHPGRTGRRLPGDA